MGYISTVDNGTTIVVTTSSEVITFTIATENAVLKEDTPNRVVVHDDVCWWTIYDLRLLCYQHTAGTPGSGMALTTDHGTGFPYTWKGLGGETMTATKRQPLGGKTKM